MAAQNSEQRLAAQRYSRCRRRREWRVTRTMRSISVRPSLKGRVFLLPCAELSARLEGPCPWLSIMPPGGFGWVARRTVWFAQAEAPRAPRAPR